MRKGRGCMLQYQHSPLRVLTPFVAQTGEGAEPVDYFLGPDWRVTERGSQRSGGRRRADHVLTLVCWPLIDRWT